MRLSKPAAPFERLELRGKSVTIDVDASSLVIPTGNINILPSFNEFALNPSRVSSAPCGGLSNSIVQDKNPGSLSIEGDSCYLQTIDESYTGKSIGAGKLAETFSITDSGTTGIALATADGIEVEMMDGNLILLSPPSAIVEQFQVRNISSGTQTYTITLKCPATINSIELHNLTSSSKETVTFNKISLTEYTFSKSISGNTTETFQFTIVYDSLNSSQSFSDDANTSIGLENMSESWISFMPKSGSDIDFIHFSERPKQLELKQNSDGSISQVILYPGNGTLSHGRIKHPNHTKVSGTGYIPDCLNKNINGSITKFLQSHGMKTDFPSDAILTTWIVPAISDNKILPLSTISDDLRGDEISLRMCPGEYGCASFVVQSDKNIRLNIKTNQHDNIDFDIHTVKCWYQGGYDVNQYTVHGKYLTPELLLHNDKLILANDDIQHADYSFSSGDNYLKLDNGTYCNISNNYEQVSGATIIPISSRNFSDDDFLDVVTLSTNKCKQFWITFHPSDSAIAGTYNYTLNLISGSSILRTISVVLEVLPISLLSPNIEYSIYYRGKITTDGSISSEYKTVEQYTAEQINMVQHGVTVPNSSAPASNDILSQELQIRQQCGIDNSNFYYRGYDVNSSIEEISAFNSWILGKYGVNQLYIYGVDEADLTSYRDKIDAIHALGVKAFCAQISSTQASPMADKLDLAVMAFVPDSELAVLYHSYTSFDDKTHKIFSYSNPQTTSEFPKSYRLNYGLLLWKTDYDGVMDYAYQHSFGDIWDDLDSVEYRDHVVAYPTADRIIDTIQWEGFREAVNDMRYLATLQAAIVDAQNRDVATIDIETWLATLKTTDLSTVDLDEIRSQMIDYILELQSSENYSAVLMADGNPIIFANNAQLFLEG